MSDPPWQWRDPTDEELGDFQGHCWPTESTVLFPRDTLTPSNYALQLYQEAGKKQMVDIDDEYAASVYSDYVTQEQEEAGVGVRPPRKKARSTVKNSLTDLRISESLIRPMHTRPALLNKVIMTLPEPLRKVMNPSTPSLDSKSIATLPNPPFNSDALRTPTRQQTPNDPYLTASPYSRAHKTGRKYLCARCIDVCLLCCWISLNTQLLQAAHLVPYSLGKPKYRQLLEYLHRAVGSRFSVNSRVNYLLLHQPIHTSFDNQGAIVYPIQPYVLDAVEDYLTWLDLQDGGEPWVNQQIPDYFKCLRSEHPLLSDGHLYAIRFTSLKAEKAVDIFVYQRYTPGQKAKFDSVVTEPYTGLPIRKVFTNPILLLLNLIHQFEKTFTSESMRNRNAWRRTKEEWKNWIEASPKLNYLVGQGDLDTLTNKTHSSVDSLARALAVAGHLRCRLPLEFQWVIEKPDDDSDVFSDPTTPCTPSQHCTSADRGPGSKEDRLGGGGSGSGRGIFDMQTGKKKRKQAEEQTDCTNIVKEWQKQNSKPQSFLRKLRLSWQSNGPKRNEGSKIGPKTDQSAWVVQSGIRSAGFRKIFGAIANRTS